MKNLQDDVFKTKPSTINSKADVTNRAVQEIVEKETAAREKKTLRLRQARLAKELAEPVIVPAKPKRAPIKRKSTS